MLRANHVRVWHLPWIVFSDLYFVIFYWAYTLTVRICTVWVTQNTCVCPLRVQVIRFDCRWWGERLSGSWEWNWVPPAVWCLTSGQDCIISCRGITQLYAGTQDFLWRRSFTQYWFSHQRPCPVSVTCSQILSVKCGLWSDSTVWRFRNIISHRILTHSYSYIRNWNYSTKYIYNII